MHENQTQLNLKWCIKKGKQITSGFYFIQLVSSKRDPKSLCGTIQLLSPLRSVTHILLLGVFIIGQLAQIFHFLQRLLQVAEGSSTTGQQDGLQLDVTLLWQHLQCFQVYQPLHVCKHMQSHIIKPHINSYKCQHYATLGCTTHSLVDKYQHFRIICCLHVWDSYLHIKWITQYHISKD